LRAFGNSVLFISVLNYIADNVTLFHLSAARRLLVTHDIPWLMADVLSFR